MQSKGSSPGATCAVCRQGFRPGQRILWRVKENTAENFGWTATHLLCPRTASRLLWLLIVVVVMLALAFILV